MTTALRIVRDIALPDHTRVQFGPWLKPLTEIQEQMVGTFATKMRARGFSTECIDTPNTVTVVATRAARGGGTAA